MAIKDQLTEAMKEAMRSKDSLRLGVIRMARTAIKNSEIDQRSELDDDGIIGTLATLVKQRREAAQMYRDNGRDDLADKEEQEIVVLQDFMPQQLSQAEIEELIEEAVNALGASSMKEMGAVMKQMTAATKGRADGRLVSELVKARLSR